MQREIEATVRLFRYRLLANESLHRAINGGVPVTAVPRTEMLRVTVGDTALFKVVPVPSRSIFLIVVRDAQHAILVA